MSPKNKLIIFILLIGLIGAGLYFFKNSQSAKHDGVVAFSLDGQKYEISGIVFIIRANPRLLEDDEIKVLSRGGKAKFMFALTPTLERQEEVQNLGINPKNLFERNSNYKIITAAWTTQTDDPEGFLKTNEISYKNSKISLDYFYVGAELPTHTIQSQEDETRAGWHTEWFKIENMTTDRITGKFGGTFQDKDLNKLEDQDFYDREVEITDGTFDLPYHKYFKYE